ncbi:pimeloyl-ACP methyl ester carboxylesterase [Asanoa ferruginea]|uniref:Pimeloyl-ACP methyl ester carboxylesterase n=1 Tax=Asanoa ferruginea TaxID=53367 RepID=A0A3D9ZLA9_9ACTN|nr:alpha/beta hydrolase [Asanoa ferruginea]REF94440.1 pimeloyl-ACP methyl ester carboxylesterase [Asanoa ferruginea]GIF52225.1 alpha/beta hydrolase [Asanoa ferruginea]
MDHYLHVDGARLYYQVTGSGPVLLISQSGEGDADRTVDLVGNLADRFTVVTYDRRGLSRSGPAGAASIRRHAEDAAAILNEVTDAPAHLLGLSLGAVIGLHIMSVQPGLIARLIAHEPIALPFLTTADADAARSSLLGVRRVHQQAGWRAAAAEVATVLGIDPTRQETEPGITRFPFTDQRAANFEYFLANDLDAALNDTLRLADIPRDGRIVPAVGTTSPTDGFDYLAGLALADHLGVPVQRFPGGHNGNLTHPRAFAHRVRELLC